MDEDWIRIACVLGAGLLALAVFARQLAKRRARARGDTRLVALVRRRRELQARLEELAGDSAGERARIEARRQGASPSSIEVLEAAVADSERLALEERRTESGR